LGPQATPAQPFHPFEEAGSGNRVRKSYDAATAVILDLTLFYLAVFVLDAFNQVENPVAAGPLQIRNLESDELAKARTGQDTEERKEPIVRPPLGRGARQEEIDLLDIQPFADRRTCCGPRQRDRHIVMSESPGVIRIGRPDVLPDMPELGEVFRHRRPRDRFQTSNRLCPFDDLDWRQIPQPLVRAPGCRESAERRGESLKVLGDVLINRLVPDDRDERADGSAKPRSIPRPRSQSICLRIDDVGRSDRKKWKLSGSPPLHRRKPVDGPVIGCPLGFPVLTVPPDFRADEVKTRTHASERVAPAEMPCLASSEHLDEFMIGRGAVLGLLPPHRVGIERPECCAAFLAPKRIQLGDERRQPLRHRFPRHAIPDRHVDVTCQDAGSPSRLVRMETTEADPERSTPQIVDGGFRRSGLKDPAGGPSPEVFRHV